MQFPIIGVCISTIHQEDRIQLIEALNKSAVSAGYRLMIFQTCTDLYEKQNPNNDGEMAVFQLIPYEKLCAMIILPEFLNNRPVVSEVNDECRKRGIPVLSIDRALPGSTVFSFSYADCFAKLVRHVIEVHHAKRLMMIAGAPESRFSNERIASFQQELEAHGLEYSSENVGYGWFWEGKTFELMEQWFDQEQRPLPDAIICANDAMAVAASTFLQKKGYELPADCIITGFDGIMQARYHMPHLTTCKQNYAKMGQTLVEAVTALRQGQPYPQNNEISFELILSQSCGCEPVSFKNINFAMHDLFSRVRLVNIRQELMCTLQSSVSKMFGIEELPSVLIEKFVFHSSIFAVSNDILELPDFGSQHTGANAFTDTVDVLYHRYFWYQQEPCSIPRSELIPDFERMLEREDPIIVCALHYFDLVLGYCIFQTEITVDEYEKIYTFMNAVNAAFGAFHKQVQIRQINSALQKANDELEKLYVHDYLTGLFNRRGFYREITRLRERQITPAVAFMISVDMDRLKYINDHFGHLEGDNALCVIAEAMQHSVSGNMICARFGGDEFAVGGIISPEEAAGFEQRFRSTFGHYLEAYNQQANNPYSVEASIGYESEPLSSSCDLDMMMKLADDRMYAEKTARKAVRQD